MFMVETHTTYWELGSPSYDVHREFLWKALPDVSRMERETGPVQLQQLDFTLEQSRCPAPQTGCVLLVSMAAPSFSSFPPVPPFVPSEEVRARWIQQRSLELTFIFTDRHVVQKSALIFYMYSYTKKHDDVTSEKKLKQLDRPLVAACSKSPKLRPPEFYKSSFHTKSHLRVTKSGARTRARTHVAGEGGVFDDDTGSAETTSKHRHSGGMEKKS